MKGLTIFLHSLRQVTGNLEGAIKISALPYAIQFGVTFFLTRPDKMAAMADDPMAMMQAGGPAMIAQLLSLAILVVTSVWMAVAWHRYILKNEAPASFIPPFDQNRLLAYFLRALLIGIVCFLLSLVLGLIAGLIIVGVTAATGSILISALIFMLLVYFPVFVVAYRLFTSLPGTAVDEAGPFLSGWDATKGENGTFVELALISVAAMLVNAIVGLYILGGIMPLFLAWTLVFNWFATMVGLSILTTLYGHYIEKRALT